MAPACEPAASGRDGLPPVLIVDGYNLIGASEEYRSLMRRDPESARRRIVDAIASYAGGGWDATVVFDAASNPEADGVPRDEGGVTVVFSPAGMSADSVVEALARGLRDEGRRVRVITSDAASRHTVAGPLLQVSSSSAFLTELEGARADAADLASGGPRRATVADAIEPSIRAILLRIRDGSA